MDQTSKDASPWVQSRRALLRQVKARVRSYIESPDPEIEQYRKAYSKEFDGDWTSASLEQLNMSIEKHRIVLGGDFHAFAQSQRCHLRILRQIEPSKKLLIGLECVESCYQEVLNEYQKGAITESDFLEKVKWAESWGFEWSHYKPIFELAKEKGYQLIALNFYDSELPTTPMALREEHAVEVLTGVISQHPESVFYVIYGDLHLAEEHLPAKVLEQTQDLSKKSVLRVFQNSEELYFQQVGDYGDLESEIFVKDDSTFCILGSPPWVQWQNYLMFLEQTSDWELDEYEQDIEVHIQSFLKLVLKDLKLTDRVLANDFAVYTPADGAVWELLSSNYEGQELLLAKQLVESERSFFVPMSSDFYLGRASVNHAASAIGHYLQAKLSGRTRSLWKMPGDFLPLVWCEALSFFVSQLVNPKRKPEDLDVIKKQLEVTDLAVSLRDAFSLVLEQRLNELLLVYSEDKRSMDIDGKNPFSFLVAARILGGMLGDRLFQSYKAKETSVEEIVNYLAMSVDEPNFSESYISLVKHVEKFRKKSSQVIL